MGAGQEGGLPAVQPMTKYGHTTTSGHRVISKKQFPSQFLDVIEPDFQ